MKAFCLCARIAVLLSFLVLANCNKKEIPPEVIQSTETESEAQAPAQPGVAGAQKCENGAAPKIISGECSGVWSVKKTADATNCEFEWKPRVTCPQGMKPLGLQSACYGVTIRPAEANKTPEECLAAYGKHPISPAYKLECCP